MEEQRYKAIIESILFAMGEAVPAEHMAAALELPTEQVKELILSLQSEYESQGRGMRIMELENSYQMCSAPDTYDYLIRIAKQPKRHTLSDAALETLSIVAYKQPVTRAQIEAIRGVSSDHAINRLLEYGLITELGRLDAPGRPILFGTTEEFLRAFGVGNLDKLPAIDPMMVEEFKAEAEAEMKVKLDI